MNGSTYHRKTDNLVAYGESECPLEGFEYKFDDHGDGFGRIAISAVESEERKARGVEVRIDFSSEDVINFTKTFADFDSAFRMKIIAAMFQIEADERIKSRSQPE